MYTGGISGRQWRLLGPACAVVLACLLTGAASAAEPTFSARGSVEQVYVTDATPGEQLSLVDGAGSTLSTRAVNPRRPVP